MYTVISLASGPCKATIYAVQVLGFTGGACSGDYGTHTNWSKKFCPLNQATVLYNSFVSFTSHLRRIGYVDFQLRKFNKKIKSILWSPVQF